MLPLGLRLVSTNIVVTEYLFTVHKSTQLQLATCTHKRISVLKHVVEHRKRPKCSMILENMEIIVV